MIKFFHIIFAFLALISFIGRVVAAERKPELLQQPWMKIAPHVVSSLLLLSGIVLVFQNDWLAANYGWIIAKIIALVGFIGCGLMTLREQGQKRWQFFGAAMLCFVYIAWVAAHKTVLPF